MYTYYLETWISSQWLSEKGLEMTGLNMCRVNHVIDRVNHDIDRNFLICILTYQSAQLMKRLCPLLPPPSCLAQTEVFKRISGGVLRAAGRFCLKSSSG